MKRSHIILLGLLLSLVSGKPFSRPTSSIFKTVAFEATYATMREVLNPPPMLKQRITGTGKSNVLNISKYIAIATQNTSTPPPFPVTGTCTYFADNGDEFYTKFEGTSTPNPDGTMVVEMTHTITGGTGQFVHATGSFTGKTLVDIKKLDASITLKGSITYQKFQN